MGLRSAGAGRRAARAAGPASPHRRARRAGRGACRPPPVPGRRPSGRPSGRAARTRRGRARDAAADLVAQPLVQLVQPGRHPLGAGRQALGLTMALTLVPGPRQSPPSRTTVTCSTPLVGSSTPVATGVSRQERNVHGSPRPGARVVKRRRAAEPGALRPATPPRPGAGRRSGRRGVRSVGRRCPARRPRPCSSTSTRSAISTVLSRWAMITAVRSARIVCSARWTSRSLGTSRLEVASSRISTAGSARKARANATSCRCPADSRPPRLATSVS